MNCVYFRLMVCFGFIQCAFSWNDGVDPSLEQLPAGWRSCIGLYTNPLFPWLDYFAYG